jgi:hypothetical protein
MEADFTGLLGDGMLGDGLLGDGLMTLMTGLGWAANLGFKGVLVLVFGVGASLVSLTDRGGLGGVCLAGIGMLKNTRCNPRDTSHKGRR